MQKKDWQMNRKCENHPANNHNMKRGNIVENSITFTYNYSASLNKEVEQIRKKYMPQEESAFEELKRLDRTVQNAGTTASLVVGIIGCLIFGVAMCMGLKVIGGGIILGVLIGIIGTAGMIAAYPLYRYLSKVAKAELTPRILLLADELSEKN